MTESKNQPHQIAINILKALEEAGFVGLFVGGSPRDEEIVKQHPKLKLDINDYDLATNASPDEIEQVLKPIAKSIDLIGKQFGVIMADNTEVATFREEVYEIQGKPKTHPAKDFFTDSSRRDFTINAMGKNRKGELLDYHGGLDDIKHKLIRFVGEPIQRIKEDISRILRGVELGSRFGFTIEENSKKTIIEQAHQIVKVPKELQGKIMKKSVEKGRFPFFLDYAIDTNTFSHLFPSVEQGEKLNRAIKQMKSLNENEQTNWFFLFSVLLQHQNPEKAYEIMSSFRFGKELSILISTTVRSIQKEHETVEKEVRELSNVFKNKQELKDFVHQYLRLKEVLGYEVNQNVYLDHLCSTIFYSHELPVNGNDLILLGIPKGKIMGEVIHELIIQNKKVKEEAIQYIKEKHLS